MPEELLKQLKDAGFPIIEHADRPLEPRTYRVGIPGHLGTYYVPTLEELIEACGVKLTALQHELPAHGNGKAYWYAQTSYEDKEDFNQFGGATPIIAVANLWLALHAKLTDTK